MLLVLLACCVPSLFASFTSPPCASRTFTHNMLAFGLSRKLCRDFLKKQAVIGSLTEGEACAGGLLVLAAA